MRKLKPQIIIFNYTKNEVFLGCKLIPNNLSTLSRRCSSNNERKNFFANAFAGAGFFVISTGNINVHKLKVGK